MQFDGAEINRKYAGKHEMNISWLQFSSTHTYALLLHIKVNKIKKSAFYALKCQIDCINNSIIELQNTIICIRNIKLILIRNEDEKDFNTVFSIKTSIFQIMTN